MFTASLYWSRDLQPHRAGGFGGEGGPELSIEKLEKALQAGRQAGRDEG